MTEAHGKLVWNELNTRDIEGAKHFLSTMLAGPSNPCRYRTAPIGSRKRGRSASADCTT
jgi:hypothetical protein